MIPNIRENPQHWNTAVVGPHTLPGTAIVTGPAGVDLDVKKSKGQDQATIEDNGAEPAALELVWRFLNKHFAEAERIIKDLHPHKQGGKRTPVSLSHGRTDLIGVNRVYIREISTPDVELEIYTVRMKLLQWVPEPKKTKAKAGAGAVPKDLVQRAIEGPGTFVQLLNETTDDGLFHTGPNGGRSLADEDFLDFMQSAI